MIDYPRAAKEAERSRLAPGYLIPPLNINDCSSQPHGHPRRRSICCSYFPRFDRYRNLHLRLPASQHGRRSSDDSYADTGTTSYLQNASDFGPDDTSTVYATANNYSDIPEALGVHNSVDVGVGEYLCRGLVRECSDHVAWSCRKDYG